MKMNQASDRSFLEHLEGIYDSRFTGKFIVESRSGLSWAFYIGLGNLLWVVGGLHPNRFIYREIRKVCPKVDLSNLLALKSHNSNCSHYYALEALLNSQKIDNSQLRAIVYNKFTEDCFDICQQEKLRWISCRQEVKSREDMYEEGLRSSFISIQTIEICNEVRTLWLAWKEQGYSSWSPNFSPLLIQPEKLREVVLENTFSNLMRLLDGTHSLRDLSSLMGQSIQRITTSLSAYIKKDFIKLIEIQDLQLNLSGPSRNLLGNRSKEPPFLPSSSSNKQLVVCIDDSSQVRKVMGLILTEAGYDYIGIQHPLNAMPTLIKKVPDLIFLDLTMPLINGYELCSQIRKVSRLQNIPIVILTSSTGIVDRIRTKVLGVSKFITKPFGSDDIICATRETLFDRKHLSIQ